MDSFASTAMPPVSAEELESVLSGLWSSLDPNPSTLLMSEKTVKRIRYELTWGIFFMRLRWFLVGGTIGLAAIEAMRWWNGRGER